MTVTMRDPEREERRREQAEIADSLKESRALDEIFARIDAGEPLTGYAGLLKGMLKATLERGLDTELADHVGYDRGDPAASLTELRCPTVRPAVPEQLGPGIPLDRNLVVLVAAEHEDALVHERRTPRRVILGCQSSRETSGLVIFDEPGVVLLRRSSWIERRS